MRYLIRSISGVVWFVFFGYLIYNNMIKSSSVNSIYKNIGMFGLQLFIVAMLFLTGAYMSWEIFIISPINDHDVYNSPIDLQLDE
jgi:hypothetical protein